MFNLTDNHFAFLLWMFFSESKICLQKKAGEYFDYYYPYYCRICFDLICQSYNKTRCLCLFYRCSKFNLKYLFIPYFYVKN